MPARMEFSFGTSRPETQRRAGRGPMRLLLIGDFSARPAAERPPLAQRPTWRVDLDELDPVMQRLAPRLSLPAGEIGFGQIDDFHPDRLQARLDVFRALRETRQRLLDPAQFAQAAAALQPTAAAPALSDPNPVAGDDLLAQLLGGRPAAASKATAAPAAGGIDALIRSIVAPHIVPDIAPQQASHVAAVDAAIGDQMRALLHAPSFQALEAAWRGAQWLISNLELGEDLQLHLFDLGRDELLADVVAAQGRIEHTGLYAALADRWRNQPGAESWSALVGLYEFGPSDTDIGLLAALAVIATQAGGPLLAGGDPALAAAPAFAGWQALRRSEVAPWIGLAAPRVLLRLPYGKAGDPIDSFAFEEFGATPVHEHFLWGCGALACALSIGRAYSESGWDLDPDRQRDIGDLPAFTSLHEGERQLQAVAERYLGEVEAQSLLGAGLMPLLSHRQRNAATLMRFQSIADPVQALRGLSRAGVGD